MRLTERHCVFIGYRMDGSMRRRIESLSGPDRQYVAPEGGFLSVLRLGEDDYVGKVVRERLTTDRIDDVRRNVLSILRRLSPETRFPEHLDILVCERDDTAAG